jgi:exopolysaccharide biosynthesis protein
LVAGGADFAQSHTISPGDTVQLYTMLPPADEVLREAIGGGPRIVRDGVPSIEHEQESLSASFATDRHPRTAIGFSRDEKRLFLVTVDGRQPGHSVGMSLEELAHLMSTQLQLFTTSRTSAHQAINLDGGGQTTMVVREQVVNRPSDPTGERPVVNALLVIMPSGRAEG